MKDNSAESEAENRRVVVRVLQNKGDRGNLVFTFSLSTPLG